MLLSQATLLYTSRVCEPHANPSVAEATKYCYGSCNTLEDEDEDENKNPPKQRDINQRKAPLY